MGPLSERFTPAMARRIADFRTDPATQSRVEELADKCSEGRLTPTERREYEASVRAINIISVLQSKARTVLAKSRRPR